MKNRAVRGMVTGAIVGATAMGVMGIMNRTTQQKFSQYAMRSAKKVADKANQLFGK